MPSQAANVNGSTQPVSPVLPPRIDVTYSITPSGSAPNRADPSPSPRSTNFFDGERLGRGGGRQRRGHGGGDRGGTVVAAVDSVVVVSATVVDVDVTVVVPNVGAGRVVESAFVAGGACRDDERRQGDQRRDAHTGGRGHVRHCGGP